MAKCKALTGLVLKGLKVLTQQSSWPVCTVIHCAGPVHGSAALNARYRAVGGWSMPVM